jgi:hypothetical protein
VLGELARFSTWKWQIEAVFLKVRCSREDLLFLLKLSDFNRVTIAFRLQGFQNSSILLGCTDYDSCAPLNLTFALWTGEDEQFLKIFLNDLLKSHRSVPGAESIVQRLMRFNEMHLHHHIDFMIALGIHMLNRLHKRFNFAFRLKDSLVELFFPLVELMWHCVGFWWKLFGWLFQTFDVVFISCSISHGRVQPDLQLTLEFS